MTFNIETQQQTTYFVVRKEGMGWGGKTLMEA